jgi:hypothetical protein
MSPACPLDCDQCPAVRRCGKVRNFCLLSDTADGCQGCSGNPLLNMEARRGMMRYLGGLDFAWPRPVQHPRLPELPVHLPVLVQGYPDPLDVPWVVLHGGRVFGVTGRQLTPKHRRPLREVYRLAPSTRLALQFYVEDRVLEGLWANWRTVIREIAELGFDLIMAPSYSVWRDAPRFEQLVQERTAFVAYHQLAEAGLPAVPDIGFSFFEPDGRLWAEWVNSQPDLQAVSIFCGGKRIHAERRAHRETVEDIALFHEQVRPSVAFILGGIHSPRRLLDYRRAAPGRRLVICNGMAYSLAQRRRLLDRASTGMVARSAREYFLLNVAFNDRVYAHLLDEEDFFAA